MTVMSGIDLASFPAGHVTSDSMALGISLPVRFHFHQARKQPANLISEAESLQRTKYACYVCHMIPFVMCSRYTHAFLVVKVSAECPEGLGSIPSAYNSTGFSLKVWQTRTCENSAALKPAQSQCHLGHKRKLSFFLFRFHPLSESLALARSWSIF